MTIAQFTKLALSFDEAEEKPHFEKPSYRVRNKIFATLNVNKKQVVLKLPLTEQSVFSDYDDEAVYAVPGAWGKQGWTIVELKKVHPDLFRDALTVAYCTVAPKKLAGKYRQSE